MKRLDKRAFFLGVFFFSFQLHASLSCRLGLMHFKGIALSMAAASVKKITNNAGYANREIHFEEGSDFSFVVGAVSLGEGAFGAVYPLKVQGDLRAAEKFLNVEDSELVVKFPHHTSIAPLNKTMKESLVAEWRAEKEIFEYYDKRGFSPHPSMKPTILKASLDSDPPFLVKKRAKGASLVKYRGSKGLDSNQLMQLEE